MLELETNEFEYNMEVARLRLPKEIDRQIAIRNIIRILQDNLLSDYQYVDWWTIAAYAEKFSENGALPDGLYHSRSTIWFAVANVVNDIEASYWWGQLYAAARTFGQVGD